MSIQYRAIRRAEPGGRTPGVAGGGQHKYYAGIVREREVSLRKIVNQISSRSTVTTADAFAVIENFLTLLPEHLLEGRTVNLGQFGRFKMYLRSRGHETPEQVSIFSIKGTKMAFIPSQDLKDGMAAIKFSKVAGAGTVTDEEEDEAA